MQELQHQSMHSLRLSQSVDEMREMDGLSKYLHLHPPKEGGFAFAQSSGQATLIRNRL